MQEKIWDFFHLRSGIVRDDNMKQEEKKEETYVVVECTFHLSRTDVAYNFATYTVCNIIDIVGILNWSFDILKPKIYDQ